MWFYPLLFTGLSAWVLNMNGELNSWTKTKTNYKHHYISPLNIPWKITMFDWWFTSFNNWLCTANNSQKKLPLISSCSSDPQMFQDLFGSRCCHALEGLASTFRGHLLTCGCWGWGRHYHMVKPMVWYKQIVTMMMMIIYGNNMVQPIRSRPRLTNHLGVILDHAK